MIQGWFDQEDQLRFEIELVDTNGVSLAVDALFDTGSTEWLVLSTQDIESLGWPEIGRRIIRTVQGETSLNVYAGQLILDERIFEVPVIGSEMIEDYLLGVPWLQTRRLVADRQAEILTLGN